MAGTFRDIAFFKPGGLVALGQTSNDRPGPKRVVRNDLGGLIAADTEILSPNPSRLYAIIENHGPSNVNLALGEGAAANYGLLLFPGGSLQLDQDFQWCGSVHANTTGTAYVRAVELSIDG